MTSRTTYVTAAIVAALALLATSCGGGSGTVKSEDIVPKYTNSAVFILAEGGFQGGASSGSGIVLDDKGHILTNNHVVQGAGSVVVRNPDTNKKISAKIVGRSPCDDLAVIEVDDASPFKPADLGTTKDIKQGSQAYAVGFPGTPSEEFGSARLSITGGLISKLDAQSEEYGLQDLIQMDVAINHGNSGGPLIDSHGKVIGINTLGFLGAGLESVNYAISIDEAKPIYEQLLEGKDIMSIGVNIIPNDPSYEDDYGIPYYDDTAVIIGIEDSSALFDEKWRTNDVIATAEGKSIRHTGDLCSVLRSHRSGDKIRIEGVGQFEDDVTGELYYDNYQSSIPVP